MTAKEYLSQLRTINLKITQMIEEIAVLKSLVLGRGIAYDNAHVQTSPQNTQEELIARWCDLEGQLEELIDAYTGQRSVIVASIHALKDPRYIQILQEHYVPDAEGRVKTLEQISRKMRYSYDRIKHLHGEALQAIQEKIDTQ